jgi:hypothetical protein
VRRGNLWCADSSLTMGLDSNKTRRRPVVRKRTHRLAPHNGATVSMRSSRERSQSIQVTFLEKVPANAVKRVRVK